jgi:pantoate--beta-alanine ligase
MQICESISSLREIVSGWKKQGLTIGFVPTMGNLHAGHLSLVRQAQEQADKVVVSIFVNPLQFGQNEDFGDYPRTLSSDTGKLREFQTDLLFIPQVSEIYPEQGNSKNTTLVTPPGDFSADFEGKSRPGHFEGVATVVNKLFNIVQPDLAVFGQKDYQQWLVLKKMVADFCLPIKMICGDIERDEDGLALSSRNQYLTAEQRAIAPKIYQKLQETARSLNAIDEIAELEKKGVQVLVTAGFEQVDYYSIRDADTLQVADSSTQKLIILVVARLGKTRLLDNLIVHFGK